MAGEDGLYIKTGFQADTASNSRAIAELEKGKKVALDAQKSINDLSKTSVGGLAQGFDKTTASIKKAEDELATFRKGLVEAADDAANIKTPEQGGGSGGGGLNVNKFRGIANTVGGSGAGEVVGVADDILDAKEGLAQLGGTLLEMGPAGIAAGIALVALTAVIGDFAKAAQEQADAINQAIDSARSVADEIAGGATSADVEDSIQKLQFRREMEKQTLAESQASYEKFTQGIKDAFGPLAGLVEGILKVIDPREEALASQIDKSNKLIGEADAKERAYNAALEKGLTSKADAKAAAEDLAKAQDKAAKEAEQAANKAAREQEQAQAKAQAAAEQRAKELAQQAQQQEDMQIKFGETLKKIAQSSQDAVADIYRKNADSTKASFTKLGRDMAAIDQKSIDAVADAQVKANQAEQNAVKEHNRALADIQKNAADAEEDARENRNFIQLAKARKDLQKSVGGEDTKFGQGAEDRAAAIRQENDDRKRDLARAKRDRQIAFGQEGEDRREGLAQALRDQQINKQRQLRDARTAYQSEESTFQRHLQNMLALRGQALNAETQMVQAQVNAVTGAGRGPSASPSNTFNSHQTINNTTIPMTTIGMGGALQMFRAAGIAR